MCLKTLDCPHCNSKDSVELLCQFEYSAFIWAGNCDNCHKQCELDENIQDVKLVKN